MELCTEPAGVTAAEHLLRLGSGTHGGRDAASRPLHFPAVCEHICVGRAASLCLLRNSFTLRNISNLQNNIHGAQVRRGVRDLLLPAHAEQRDGSKGQVLSVSKHAGVTFPTGVRRWWLAEQRQTPPAGGSLPSCRDLQLLAASGCGSETPGSVGPAA